MERAFTNKLGALKDSSGHHIFFYLRYEDREYTVGKLSHSWRGALNDTQLGMLARKLHLTKCEFEQWVECALSNDEMIGLWIRRREQAK